MSAVTSPQAPSAAQLAAIEQSGWGRSFRLFQPHNLAFWVYALLVGSGGLAIYNHYVLTGVHAYGQAFAVGVVVFALYTVPFWWFLRSSDRYSTIPGGLALAAFVYGGFAATGAFAIYANDSIRTLYAKVVSQTFAFDWSAALTAPFVEETAKASGLILLMLLAPTIIRNPFDGLIVGAFLGLGFQIVENLGYIVGSASAAFGFDQIGAVVPTLGVRMLTGIASHWVYSAIFCAGLVYFLGRPGFAAQRGRGLLLMALAMLLHGLWDGAAALTAGNTALAALSQFGLPFVLLGVFALVYRTTLRTEQQSVRDILAPEVDRGTLTAEELDAVSGTRRQRRHHVNAARRGADRKAARHVLHAALDLTEQLAIARAANTPAVEHARSEIARVRAGSDVS